MWNPIRSYSDYVERKKMKEALLHMCQSRLRTPNDMVQLGDAAITTQFADKQSQAGKWTQVLEEFCRENKQYTLILWSGVPSLTLTKGVESLPKELQQINEAAGFILKGGKF